MEMSKRYNSIPVKDNCALFAPTRYFRALAIRWCHFNFFSADPRCYSNEFLDKIDYRSARAKDNCTPFSPIYFLFSGQWCYVNFSPEDPCCHGNRPFLFKDKIGCRLTRASNAEMQLLGYIVWQWHRWPTSFHRTYF